MWGRFVRWLRAEGIDLFNVTAAALQEFLEQKDQTREGEDKRVLRGATIRRQYLTLFERVFTHLHIDPNPATHVCFEVSRNRATLVGRNEDKISLTPDQQDAFMRALPDCAKTDDSSKADWRIRRDRAMLSIMLGAGLKVSEAIGLYTENVDLTEGLGGLLINISPASAGGTVKEHQTLLRPFAVPVVREWIAERKNLDVPGKLLFPATSKGTRMDKSTVYLHVKACFERAGIDLKRKGGRTLRNAFAITMLKSGSSVETVTESLGHRQERAIEPYVAAAAIA